jgi:hypothetical protein
MISETLHYIISGIKYVSKVDKQKPSITQTTHVNSIIHAYMTHTFPEDMFWIQCILRKRNPFVEKNRSFDKMEWLIEDFKLLVRSKSVSKDQCVDLYADINKCVSFQTLDGYMVYIHDMFSNTSLTDLKTFHPDLFDHHLCFHNWRK